jgi:ribosomal protein L16 Arg81 hydroxylase
MRESPDTSPDARTVDAVIARMIGDPSIFFVDCWRKRPLYVPAAGIELANSYGIDDFLNDLARTQPAPYLSVAASNGNRVLSKHQTTAGLREGVRRGGVCAIKASKIWHHTLPPSWSWMRALFGSLCRRAAMIYMTPARSEDVDIFLAGPDSCLGTHFDTTDVFTLQLVGERRWELEEDADTDRTLSIARHPEWNPAREIAFEGPTRDVTLHPGDMLYAPAYGLHRVTGVSWSVSLSLGLRAFNEIDVAEHLLETIRLSGYLDYAPVVGIPDVLTDAHAEAKLHLMRGVRALLQKVEGLALATVLAELQLPPDLVAAQGSAGEATGIYRSGFALEQGDARSHDAR